MRTNRQCLQCFERQTADVCALAGLSDGKRDRAVAEVRRKIAAFPSDHPPVEMAGDIHAWVSHYAGGLDPYADIKRLSNQLCRAGVERMQRKLAESSDPDEDVLKLAIAGNTIDFGAFAVRRMQQEEVMETIEDAFRRPLSGDPPADFWRRTAAAERILFLGDNAGECFFDRPLLERLPPEKLTYVVRGAPVLNDATREDALAAGIDEVCPVIDTGDSSPGVVPRLCSAEFREIFARSDLVVAKGQGNYEALSGFRDRHYVFLTKVKCDVIAEDIGFPTGSHVLKIHERKV